MTGIYKITNQVNGKVYIGQSRNIKQRWNKHHTAPFNINDHCYELPLYRAIRKYGLENFSFEVIEECLSKELDNKESYWIKYYDSLNPEKGYNLSSGGQNGSHFGKLNYNTLQEIKNLIKNSDTLLKDIAKMYNISLIAIKDINQGYSYFDEEEEYPLRKKKDKRICPICGEMKSEKSQCCLKCASQKQRKAERPNREELKQMIRVLPFTEISKQYGVSDNAIRKWCDFENLPRKKNEINKYTDEEWAQI